MFILIGPRVRHFSDGNQTVCPTLKNKSWLPILPKQRKRYMLNCQQFSLEEMLEQFDMSKEYFDRLFTCEKNSPIKRHNSSFHVGDIRESTTKIIDITLTTHVIIIYKLLFSEKN
jgi:hypothetical protein